MKTKPQGATDFYVFVRLNRGSKHKGKRIEAVAPDYWVIPDAVVGGLIASAGWKLVNIRSIEDLEGYKEAWHQIEDRLRPPQ